MLLERIDRNRLLWIYGILNNIKSMAVACSSITGRLRAVAESEKKEQDELYFTCKTSELCEARSFHAGYVWSTIPFFYFSRGFCYDKGQTSRL